MIAQATKEQATQILQMLTAEHAQQAYFKKAEVGSNDGFGVDLYVDKDKWKASGCSIPTFIDSVPIWVMLVG